MSPPLVLSANLGFLFSYLPLPDRIRAAKAAGFDAVEFHDEVQDADPEALRQALKETGLPVCGLNVRMGASAGCAALPGRADEARDAICEGARAAEEVGAPAIHVLAGRGVGDRAQYIDVLRFALSAWGGTVLIEPICRAAMPDYALHDLDEAAEVVAEVGDPRLKLMFDIFHVGMQHGRVAERFAEVAPLVGHVQIAALPGRAEPDGGTEDIAALVARLRELGYTGGFGCEYRPAHPRDFGWLEPFRARVRAAEAG